MRVIFVGAKEQVIRVDARAHIASVTDKKSDRDLANKELIRESVCTMSPSRPLLPITGFKLAVPGVVKLTEPDPAAVAVDLGSCEKFVAR